MQQESNGFTQAIDFQLKQVRSSQLDVGINIERRLWEHWCSKESVRDRPYSMFTMLAFGSINTEHACADITCDMCLCGQPVCSRIKLDLIQELLQSCYTARWTNEGFSDIIGSPCISFIQAPDNKMCLIHGVFLIC